MTDKWKKCCLVGCCSGGLSVSAGNPNHAIQIVIEHIGLRLRFAPGCLPISSIEGDDVMMSRTTIVATMVRNVRMSENLLSKY
jgi:hypothetical protein